MEATTISPNYEPLTKKISFSRKASTDNATYAYHRHDGCEVYLFLSGNIRLYIEQTCFSPVPGSLVIINSNEMHRIQCMDNSPYERIVINLKKSYMEALSPDRFSLSECFYARPLGLHNLRVLSSESLNEFINLYRNLETSISPDCFGNTVVQNAYASLLLLFLNKQFQANSVAYKNTMPSYITGTMQYIESHLDRPLRLAVLANQFHISENYLSAQFKHHTGLTLRAYLLDRKINSAKLLLQEGATVTEACYRSGFNDYANFIRSFKKHIGVSPGKF